MNKEKDEKLKKEVEEREINELYKTDEDRDFDGHEGRQEDETQSRVYAGLVERIKNLEEANAEYVKLLQRERADFENFRRRNQTGMADARQAGLADAVTAILPVTDNFERAFDALDKDEQEKPFAKGIAMVYKQFLEILGKLGLEEIPAAGECFDPNLHHAVMQESAGEGEKEGDIKEVFSKGYKLNGKVIRHCMVKVIGE
jgi:molecular chaperone GrpE